MENRSVQLKLYYRKKLLVSLKTFKQLIQLISVFLSVRPFSKKIKQVQEKLTKVVEGAKKPDPVKRTTTSSGDAEKGKTQYSDDDTVGLNYARTYLDHEFNQRVNNRDGKWAMIQNIYNGDLFFPCPIFLHSLLKMLVLIPSALINTKPMTRSQGSGRS